MTYLNLQERIEKSRKAIEEYPEWARRGCVFHGGGVTRNKNDSKKMLTSEEMSVE